MEDRIPPSLKWLVTKRSVIHGEILKAEKRLQDYLTEHQSIINKLKTDLQAIDHTLGLHEILIDPEIIPPVRKHSNATKLKYGAVTRYIFECLRDSSGQSSTTTEIANFVVDKTNLDIMNKHEFTEFRHTVRKRLKTLRSEGKVKCAKISNHNEEKRWSLP